MVCRTRSGVDTPQMVDAISGERMENCRAAAPTGTPCFELSASIALTRDITEQQVDRRIEVAMMRPWPECRWHRALH